SISQSYTPNLRHQAMNSSWSARTSFSTSSLMKRNCPSSNLSAMSEADGAALGEGTAADRALHHLARRILGPEASVEVIVVTTLEPRVTRGLDLRVPGTVQGTNGGAFVRATSQCHEGDAGSDESELHVNGSAFLSEEAIPLFLSGTTDEKLSVVRAEM